MTSNLAIRALHGHIVAGFGLAVKPVSQSGQPHYYNELCAAGVDDDFGKDAPFLTEIKPNKGYYAFEYCGGYWTTLGGIRTDDRLVAVDENNEPIPGVYVGGANMGSAFCRPYYDIPGSCCGLSIASGILAAKEIIAYLG